MSKRGSNPKLKINQKLKIQKSKNQKIQNSKTTRPNLFESKIAGHHAPGLSPGAVIQRARAHGARVGLVFRAAAA
jgi:hypothetical protein